MYNKLPRYTVLTAAVAGLLAASAAGADHHKPMTDEKMQSTEVREDASDAQEQVNESLDVVAQEGQWSGPAFYNFGRVSAGLQAGVAAGAVVMLLMTQDTVQPFKTQNNNFFLDATAGMTVINYSADTRSTAGSRM